MKLKMPLAIGLVLAGVSVPMFAHHSFGMFDLQKNMEFDGVVQEYNWENPHTHIIVKVAPGAKDPFVRPFERLFGRRGEHHGPPGMDARNIQGGRQVRHRRPPHEGRHKGCVAVLRHHARRDQAVSRYRSSRHNWRGCPKRKLLIFFT